MFNSPVLTVLVPSREVEKGSDDKFFTVFNPETKTFFLQFSFKLQDRSFPKQQQSGPVHAPQLGGGDRLPMYSGPGGLPMPPPPPPHLGPSLTPGPMPTPIGTPMLPPPPPPSV